MTLWGSSAQGRQGRLGSADLISRVTDVVVEELTGTHAHQVRPIERLAAS
jgi:hypothetical protein